MGILRKFDDFKIKLICNNYNIKNYIINDNGTIDVDGDVYFYNRNITKLPLKFGDVSGNFTCSGCNLKTLDGVPSYIGGDLSLPNNRLLKSLKGSPLHVGGNYDCTNCGLETLEGIEDTNIGDNFDFTQNDIYTFDNLPKSYKSLGMGLTPLVSLGFGTFVNNPNFMDLWDAYDPVAKEGNKYVVYLHKLNLLRAEFKFREISEYETLFLSRIYQKYIIK